MNGSYYTLSRVFLTFSAGFINNNLNYGNIFINKVSNIIEKNI